MPRVWTRRERDMEAGREKGMEVMSLLRKGHGKTLMRVSQGITRSLQLIRLNGWKAKVEHPDAIKFSSR